MTRECQESVRKSTTFCILGLKTWCAREDLNLQSFRNQILSLARLPFRHARVEMKMAWNTAKLKKEAGRDSGQWGLLFRRRVLLFTFLRSSFRFRLGRFLQSVQFFAQFAV